MYTFINAWVLIDYVHTSVKMYNFCYVIGLDLKCSPHFPGNDKSYKGAQCKQGNQKYNGSD